MGKELVISATRHETQVAVLEDDQLVEIYLQRANEYSLAGSIHKGRVTRVLPGMQSAFVDIGLERDAFLYVADFFEENEEYDRIPVAPEDREVRAPRVEAAPPSARPIPPAAAPPGTQPVERGGPDEGRDPSGRRPRRRRMRGRGFGESKYAFETPAPVARPPAEPLEPQRTEGFPVLPGESLAKHRGPAEAPAAEAEGAEPELVTPEPELAAPAEPEAISEQEPAALAAAEAEAAAAECQPEPAAGEQPPAEELEPARTPISLTATLREQGYRYMHRVSRRMRRKTRGGGLPEPRPEDRPAAPPPPAATEAAEERPESQHAARPERPLPSIAELLKEGQEVVVQIAKEPLGQKGARITSYVALPGRFVVYMPTVEHLGVSRKVASEEERHRLRRILQAHRAGKPGGFIVRTVGEGRSEHDIAQDMEFLYSLWLDIRQKAESRPAPLLLHHDLDLVERILRDQLTESFKTVWVDNEEVYERVLHFIQRFQPASVGRIKMYTRTEPIFDAFNVTAELEKALRPKVWLKSGGYIVINQTEALVAIDVNTGKFVGRSNRLEDTILKTNTEAIKEIVRQIRLRDLGGIIVVDFIDMDERKNRQRVMQVLEEAMRADRAPSKTLQFNDFGLVAITRKRVKQSLERTLCSPCPYCEAAGYVKSVQTVVGEILREAHKVARAIEGKEAVLRVNPEVAKVLKSSDNDYLDELEEILGRPVMVTGDLALHQEKFDLV
jgi:ribonuclease G